jgi:CrcB protein
VGVSAPDARPVHLRWSAIGLVFAGGTVGTLLRYALGLALPPWNSLPVAVFVANIVGAFALGWLLEALLRRGPDAGIRRSLRLLLGTGMLGGFTTYSAFAVDTDGLLGSAHLVAGLGYGLLTVFVGAAASVLGIAVGAALTRSRSEG